MRPLYSLAVHLLRPAIAAHVLWRGVSDRRHWQGFAERFGHVPPRARVGGAIWLHAVSLGEVNAAAPLLRALRERYPQYPLLVSTATLTGRERATALFGDAGRVAVCYLPYDTPGAMRRFIAQLRPRLLIVMETELWPNLFEECRRRAVPVVLANARLSPRSVRRYRRFRALFSAVFAGQVRIAAQSAQDAARFIEIGADPARTTVTGNVKFDLAVPPFAGEHGRALRSAQWPGRPVWIAGSTHAGEEEAAIQAHSLLRRSVPAALLVLVPRHPQRFETVAQLLLRGGVRFERRSTGGPVAQDSAVLLGDTVGELASLYAAVDLAFVGGSLVPVGGHNLLEPAALGVPVITGPHQANGRQIANALVEAGAALQVADADGLAGALTALFADPARRRRMGESGVRLVQANRGSVARLLELLKLLESMADRAREG